MPFCAPQIVYSNSWLGQTASISATALFTTTSGAVYRASVVLVAQPVSGPGYSVSSSISPNGPAPLVNSNSSLVDQVGQDGVFVGDGSSLSFSTSLGGSIATSSYAAHVVVEQIQ